MKQREVQDSDHTTWTCVQAYTGLLSHDQKNEDAAKVAGTGDYVNVVCTPSGGAQTVRLELPDEWLEELSDEDLLHKIEENHPK